MDVNEIHAEHVSRAYRMGDGNLFYAVRDISIDIPKGKLIIIKGRSGSGKTTLINMLSGLDNPTEGDVLFDGSSMSKLSARKKENIRRKRMGFVFQSVALIPVMTAYENVDFALKLAKSSENRDARIKELMNKVGLRKRMEHMAGQLSGGEQQRVAIARAVAHHPSVVFADEPTGALDTASGLAVMRLFRELVQSEGITIVMTTHDPGIMELGDILYEIEDGRITDTKCFDHGMPG